ncbi:Uncharacterised protein [Mycobacteroides abscessus subsp. massiliense]|uniref:hypothetical protein n=1 Tax=Mycobacteroides abscessus TaxID=36809 RepID=UPI0009A7BE7E|nr:hypothetical protein [Mycobacteroides abscessus]SKY30269.1 Uncharacterised protein [Mycobacteroides abscessus subsp. massiliense]SKY71800.1 Uncharacterised protein [Mycobacteroides abscessus subsp. massiliense]
MSDEPSDAQKLIRAAMRKHRIGWYGNHDKRCFACPGTSFFDWDEADAHVAAEVDKALGGLTVEWTITGSDDEGEWIADQVFPERPEPRPGFYEGGVPTPRWTSGWTVTE